MAIDRFQDENILLNSKQPVENVPLYDTSDIVKLGSPLLDFNQVETNHFLQGNSTTEIHVYSGDNLLQSIENTTDYSSGYYGAPFIKLTPEDDVRITGAEKGYYSIVYNFLTTLTDKRLKIERISADGTEIELLTDSSNSLSRLYQLKEELPAAITNYDPTLPQGKLNYVLNFGSNDLVVIADINFDSNITERVGFKTVQLDFPTSTFTGRIQFQYPLRGYTFWDNVNGVSIPGGTTKDTVITPYRMNDNDGNTPNGSPGTTDERGVLIQNVKTTFYPSFRDFRDGEYFYIEAADMMDVPNGWMTPQIWNDEPWNTYVYLPGLRATGRVAKFIPTLVPDATGVSKMELVQEKDSSGNDIFHYGAVSQDTVTNLETYFDIVPGREYSGDEPVDEDKKVIVKYFDDTLKVPELKKVVVKLYKPLNPALESKLCSIDLLNNNSYIERLLLYPFKKIITIGDFSPPNWKIDLGNYGKSQGTDLKSWNDLLDANLSTSQQIINKYISSSFGEMDMNVDYSELDNFVHYSSAVERVKNFKYKIQLIESYDARIATLNDVSGSHALTNISQSIDRKNKVISGFDGFEYWMYYEPTGSLYTHYTSSTYQVSPWPKQTVYPLVQEQSTTSTAETYYNSLIDTATTYDVFNDSRLTKLIPQSLASDDQNLEYLLFIDMIGHHFDITWSYIKKLTSLATREEHPYDGIPNELLYNVAKSAGWQLLNGKQATELWKYAAGKDQSGNPIQSGSIASKSDEQINYEVWRRIVNNLPYLLKTKGTRRSIKALIATYGIPSTFLNIKEYGGPIIEPDEITVRPIYEHDKFVYRVKMDDTTNYISVPWGNINDLNPNTYVLDTPNPIDTIELQFSHTSTSNKHVLLSKSGSTSNAVDFLVLLEPDTSTAGKGNIHLYLSGSGGYKSASISDVPVFDNKMSSLFLKRDTSVNDIHENNSYTLHYRRQRNGEIAVRASASISISGDATASFNPAWTGSGTFTVGNASLPGSGVPSLWGSSNYINGFVQEIRYYTDPLNDTVMDDHTLSRMSYHGNSPTASYFDLKFRFLPSSELKVITNPHSVSSKHPNQNIITTSTGATLSASIVGVATDNLNGVTDTYYTKTPSVGANNILNNKVRVESSTLSGILDPDHKKEKSRYDSAPVDSNKVGVYLSATNMYNEDVLNHTGFFTIDDYIGNPDSRNGYHDTNVELEHLRRQVFKKYSSKNLINTVIGILTRFDFTVFQQIKQVLPARVDYDYGILIEPHILERPKVTSNSSISYTRPQYNTTIKIIDGISPTGSYNTYNGTITNIYNVTASREDIASVGSASLTPQYAPAVYQYTILNYSAGTNIGFGVNWTTGSNGYWNYNPTGSTVINNTSAPYAQTENYFYSSSLSASMKIYYSSSLSPAQTSTDGQSLTMNNLKFNGCKVSSDSLTTNSPDTPDGLPVIEVFPADPNVLVVTAPLAQGSLTIDSNTGLQLIPLQDTIAYGNMLFQEKPGYDKLVSTFKQEIQSMTEFEEDRTEAFDEKYNQQLDNQSAEDNRQALFDNKNT
jgi:hypothetical protein